MRELGSLVEDITGQEVEMPQAKVWTKGEVVEAIQRWARERGRFPSSVDWQAPKNGYDRPNYDNVRTAFGSWREAMWAAGMPSDVRSDYVHVDSDGTVTVEAPVGTPTHSAPEPEPELAVDPEPETQDEPPSLVHISTSLQMAKRALDKAQAVYDEAEEEFRSHPLVREATGT